MAILVKCPKCKADIENDSYFCDQCGTELYICPQCRTFGKGKRCTQCASELVKASAFTSGAAPQPTAPQPTAPQPAEPQPTAPQPIEPQPAAPQSVEPQPTMPQAETNVDKTIRPVAPAVDKQPALQPGHIVCANPRIRLGLASGVIIGRRGHYPTVFGAFGDVSGNHARLDQVGAEWKVTDLGSTNGTFLNGQMLQPQIAYTIHVGDTIRFSTLEFKVEV